MYLLKYGYIDLSSGDSRKSSPLLTKDDLHTYIEEFQAFANLTVTGTLDGQTMEMMARPRCGVKDFTGRGPSREKRYALQGKPQTKK